MRKTILALLLVLPLGGCAGIPLPDIQNKVDATVAQVQAIARQLCGWEPTFSTVANIIASFAGAGDFAQTTTTIAHSICAAVTAKGVRRGGGPPKVHGVVLRGRFVPRNAR